MLDFDWVLWDDEDRPSCNIRHIAIHEVTTEEVEDVLFDPEAKSFTSHTGRLAVRGLTREGRDIEVIYEMIVEDRIRFLRPITAYQPTAPDG